MTGHALVGVPLTVTSSSYRHAITDFHVFRDTTLTRSMKTSIFCEIRFARREVKEWFYGGFSSTAPWESLWNGICMSCVFGFGGGEHQATVLFF